jgi:hypothetical protein
VYKVVLRVHIFLLIEKNMTHKYKVSNKLAIVRFISAIVFGRVGVVMPCEKGAGKHVL